jgi:hypothetical protein
MGQHSSGQAMQSHELQTQHAQIAFIFYLFLFIKQKHGIFYI